MTIIGKIGAIGEGWSKWLGLQNVSQEEKELSIKRMDICSSCEFATKSKFLEFIAGNGEEIDSLYCTKCTCPCHQKSLSNEVCPLGKWDNL